MACRVMLTCTGVGLCSAMAWLLLQTRLRLLA